MLQQWNILDMLLHIFLCIFYPGQFIILKAGSVRLEVNIVLFFNII